MIKRILFFLIVLTLFEQKSFSSPKDKIISNFNKINNISFKFQQKIADKIESGKCYIKYPKLIYCLYDNKDKKEMVEKKSQPSPHLIVEKVSKYFSQKKR